MKFLIFGGSSPIAIAISQNLATVGQVWHVTRKNNESFQNHFNGMDVKILELDLNSVGNFMGDFSLMLEKENFDGIVFAHR